MTKKNKKFRRKDDSYKLIHRPEDDYTPKGRTTIDSPQRLHGSRRARKGSLSVENKTCPKCGHHKMFSKIGELKCCKCKTRFKQ